MKKQLMVIILSACFYNLAESMETFMATGEEFGYTSDCEYNAKYQRKTALSWTETQQLNQLKEDIEILAKYLQVSIANLIAEYSFIICTFPKEGPTFNDTITITVTKTDTDNYFINTKHQPNFKIKDSLSKEEESYLAEFKNKLNAIVLTEEELNLEDILNKHNNLIIYLTDGPAIELDIEILMKRQ